VHIRRKKRTLPKYGGAHDRRQKRTFSAYLLVMQRGLATFGAGVPHAAGNANGDDLTDASDLDVREAQLRTTVPAVATIAMPEPGIGSWNSEFWSGTEPKAAISSTQTA
jgi:hypothetical protein